MSNIDNSMEALIKSALLNLNNTESNIRIVNDHLEQTIGILNNCIEIIENNKISRKEKFSEYTENFFNKLSEALM